MYGGNAYIMKYKVGTEVEGLIVKEHRGRQLLCECANCHKEVTIELTSISRKRRFGKKYCQDCITRRTDDNYIIELAILDFKKKGEARGHKWSLSFDQVKDLVLSNCHYCGSEPWTTRFQRNYWNSSIKINGIDRKDNSKGYYLQNCVPCCGICNRAKSSMTYQDFMNYINRIKENRAN